METTDNDPSLVAEPDFVSELPGAAECLRAELIEFCRRQSIMSGDQFISHFSVAHIVELLEDVDERDIRSNLLTTCVGLNRIHAEKISRSAATELLELSISEGLASKNDFFLRLPADVLGGMLKASDLVEAVIDKIRDAQGTSFLLRRAYKLELLSADEILDGLNIEELAHALLPQQTAQLWSAVRAKGLAGNPFLGVDYLEILKPSDLANIVEPKLIWGRIITPLLIPRLREETPSPSHASPPSEERSGDDGEVTIDEAEVQSSDTSSETAEGNNDPKG